FQAEDGIRDRNVTGVQTCALPILFVSPPHAIPASALWAIAVLAVVCTALGLIVFFRLIAEAGPGRASVITYINPLVAVLLGVVRSEERRVGKECRGRWGGDADKEW